MNSTSGKTLLSQRVIDLHESQTLEMAAKARELGARFQYS
jgi:hypothetical protein